MQLLNNILQSGFSFSKEEETLRLKYRLVNAILTFDIVVVSIAGLLRFYHHQIPQGTIDIIYAFSAFVMFILARKYRHLFDSIIRVTLILAFLVVMLSFTFSSTGVTGVAWYIILILVTAFLADKKFLYFIVVSSILSIIAITYYANHEICCTINLVFSLIPVIMTLVFISFYEQRNQMALQVLEEQKRNAENYSAKLEKEVQEQLAVLREKDGQLLYQSKLAQMGEIISMIAHQWRQPLTAISSANSSLLTKSELGQLDQEELTKKLNDINMYTQHLSATIDDFRSFFKYDKVMDWTNYDEVLSGLEGIIMETLTSNDITLKITLDPNAQKFKAYPNELKQVVLNLVKNAQDAMTINAIPHGVIEITSFNEDEYNVLKVTDNAGGIDDTLKDKIFEPYFTTKEQYDGTGLGLYMSKTIIEKHMKGKLHYVKETDGSSFMIYLKAENE